MLFVIGLELDPRRLARHAPDGVRRRRDPARGVRRGAGRSRSWRSASRGRRRWSRGLALALSSTAIAMQAMTERNELDTPTGQPAFGILLFQDIAAIPLIALVPFLGHVERPRRRSAVDAASARAVAAIAGVVVIGRYLTRPALRLIARTDMRELFTAFALLLVIGIAELMALAGLSMALGAFLAGVLLAGSEYRHALESDIEPFKGLLLGLFFISVGMTIDFGLLGSRPGTVVAAARWASSRSRSRRSGSVARSLEHLPRALALRASCSRRAASSRSSCSASARDARRVLARVGGAAHDRGGALDGDHAALARSLHDRSSRAARGAEREADTRRARGPGDHRGLRALRPDRRAPAVRERHRAPWCSTTIPTRSSRCASSATACSTATPRASTCCEAAGARKRAPAGERDRRRRGRASRSSTACARTSRTCRS